MRVTVVIHYYHTWVEVLVVSLFGSLYDTFWVTMKASPQRVGFRSVPAQGSLGSVSEVCGIFVSQLYYISQDHLPRK